MAFAKVRAMVTAMGRLCDCDCDGDRDGWPL